MSAGKEEIWKITQPSKTNSVFQSLVSEYRYFLPAHSTGSGLAALPLKFVKLYELDAASTVENNPYHAAASSLAKSLNSDCNLSIILNFLSFINHMTPDYKRLLERKDPCASAAGILVRQGLPMPTLVDLAAGSARMPGYLHTSG
jgi:hypothetical protein